MLQRTVMRISRAAPRLRGSIRMTHAARRTQSSCTSLAQLRAAAHDQFQVLDGQRGLGAGKTPRRANRAVFPQQDDVLRLVTDAANRLKAGTLGVEERGMQECAYTSVVLEDG